MSKKVLYIISFLVKGLEVSILLLLPILQIQGIITIFQIGLLGAIMSIAQIVSNLQAGHLAEKISSKNVLALGVGMYVCAWLSLIFGRNIEMLSVTYVLAGIGSGIFIPIANSFVAKAAENNRATEMGNFSAYTDLGRVAFSSITTTIIGFMGLIKMSSLYGISGLILLILFIIKTKEPKTIQVSISTGEILEKITIVSLLKDKNYLLSVSTGVFDGFASASLYIFIPLLLITKEITLSTSGFLSSLFFLGYFSGRLLLGRMADKHGSGKILILAEICMAILIGGIIFVNNIVLVAVILFALGIFTRGTSPIIRAMVAETVSEKRKFDKAYGFYSFSVNSSSIASRSIFGVLAGTFGIASVFYLSSFVALLTIIPIMAYSKHKKVN